ncbi:MAG TPA: CapA family protein [Gemmatimonadaceae bacterium]|nr:CapA family protein [Gemmatimonadaceae bacterium]
MSNALRRAIVALSFGLSASSLAPAQQPGRPAAPGRPFTMALVGDALITRPLAPYREPEFLRMLDLLRGADAAFANLEMLFHDYEPSPMYQSGGTWMRAEPALAKELAWAGIDVVGMANNHTGDYGPEGARLTRKYVAEAGLVGAGTGENLYEAREARFFDAANGRVALISVASTFPEHSAASKPRGAVRGRPGLSPLRFTSQRVVTREQLEQLRAALRNTGLNVPASGNTLSIAQTRFAVGETPGVRTTPDPQDLAEIAAVVRDASRLADYVVVSMHAHEGGARSSEPAEFLVTFARAMIDAGAHVFVGHGPHVLRGIEIYKGKPIFYSLGDFIFQNETVLRLPYDSYAPYNLGDTSFIADFNDARYSNDTRGFPAQREIWESVVARAQWHGKELVGLELHPITLGFGLPRTERGRPMLAGAQLGQKIVNDLIERSKAWGTVIEWRDGVGVVRVK